MHLTHSKLLIDNILNVLKIHQKKSHDNAYTAFYRGMKKKIKFQEKFSVSGDKWEKRNGTSYGVREKGGGRYSEG